MTDESTKPGLPSTEAFAENTEKETSIADPDHLASTALSALQHADKTLLRLNKLLASPGGLSAFLSTFNYTLYILAYMQTKSPTLISLAQKLLGLVPKPSAVPKPTLINAAGVPPIAALALLISKARSILRLFGLLPLYAWLRTLLSGAKPGADPVLHRIAVVQASSYFTYQALENISLLADSGIVPSSFIAAINRGDSKTTRVYLWGFRAWLSGVTCDFLRLGREWQLEARRRSVRAKMQREGKAVAEYQDGEDEKFDQRWWTDVMIAGAWFPIALHFSSGTGGLPGWNLGWMGLCGLVAGSTRVRALWAATE